MEEESESLDTNARPFPVRMRGSIVMEKLQNPFLDRSDMKCVGDLLKQKRFRATIDNFQANKDGNAEDLFVRAPLFDAEYHSIYVSAYGKEWHGIFVLFSTPLLLICIGTFSACIGLFINVWLAEIWRYHCLLFEWGFAYFAVSSILAASLSAAVTFLCCPQAAGSGLPFMKVAISGVDMREYLTWRCVFTKIIGLVAAFAAGLSIGKEGPFIMISCGFAYNCMKLPFFERIFADEKKRLEMLACACSAGVAATFGSPFGGVLFGVEVTSDFYMVRTLPRSFFAAITGAVIVNFLSSNARYGLFERSAMNVIDIERLHGLKAYDLAVYIAIGIACGLGGALFNHCISILVQYRDHLFAIYPPRTKSTAIQSIAQRLIRCGSFWESFLKRLLIVAVVTFISSVSEFYGDPAWFIHHGAPHRILKTLFSKHKDAWTSDAEHTSLYKSESVLLSRSLLTYLPLKFMLTLLSVALPIPAGLFTPTFIIGGIFGRLIGEAITAFGLFKTRYEPFEYAIIGAGAFSSGATHAISTAVIIMEASHTDSLNLPVSVAILAAYFTAKQFTDNVYDTLILTSKLPRLKKLPKAAYDIPAWEIMQDIDTVQFLTADSAYNDAIEILKASQDAAFAIVDSLDKKILLATVMRKELEDAIVFCRENMLHARRTSPNYQTFESKNFHVEQLRNTFPAAPSSLALQEDNLFEWPIHFAYKRGGKIIDWGTNELCTSTQMTVLINISPFQLMPMTPMRRVDLLFRMLKLTNVYITRSGKLIGVISRDRMMNFLGNTQRFQVPGFCRAIRLCFDDFFREKAENTDALSHA